VELFQNPEGIRFREKIHDLNRLIGNGKKEEMQDEKLTEITEDVATDIAMSSVVLEHWEEKIRWSDEDTTIDERKGGPKSSLYAMRGLS
jgi:hypothetical protein